MNKLKKKVSKTVFASFFIFQFVVSTAFMPVVLNAEDMEDVSNETTSSDVVSEEAPSNKEESTVSEQPTVESETSTEVEISENSSEPKNSTEIESIAGGNNGSLKTTNASCVDVNINQYQIGEILWLYASGFDPNTEYPWSVYRINNSNEIIGYGTATTNENGEICLNTLIQFNSSNTGTPGYKADFGGEKDNFTVVGIQGPNNGILKVCKILVDENNQVINLNQWSQFVNEDFSIDFNLREENYSFSFATSGQVFDSVNQDLQANCEELDITISGETTISYSEEVASDFWTPKYYELDVEGDSVFIPDMAKVFNADSGSDGELWISGNGFFTPTLYIVNQYNSPTNKGSIKVCKIIIDKDFMIVEDWSTLPGSNTFAINFQIVEDWSTLPGSNTFAINFQGRPVILNSSFNEAGIPSPVVFNTAVDNVNDSVFEWSIDGKTLIQDANCKIINNLDLGGYFYNPEVISGDNIGDWIIRGYNDGFSGEVEDFNDIYAYDNTLFTVGDSARNMNSDGHIVLTEQNPNRTLVVMNRYKGEYDPTKNNPPVINTNPVEVCLPFDLMTGVTATDIEDGDLTSSIEIVTDGGFSSGLPGTYYVVYRVIDSKKAYTEITRAITIKQNCSETPSCEANGNEIWAKITLDLNQLENEGAGDLQSRIYVGSNSTYINSGEWFMVHDGTNAVVDATLFENVPGVAVQRVNGKVRFGIHGSHPERRPYAYERVVGTIEFFQGDITTWENDLSDNGKNKVDLEGVAVPDTVSVANNVLLFDLGVDIEDDFLYAPYVFNPCDDDNGGGEDDLVVQIPNTCVARGTENFDIFSGLSVSYLGSSVDLNDVVKSANPTSIDVNTNGTYTVTYTIEYAGITETVERTIEVKNRCSGGGGGGGGGSSSGGSSRSEGEVLGATSCVAFTTYNRLGNKGGEIKALQTFLNEYMNAGLTVDGVYGRTTAQAVHDFQAFHWKEVIDPWTPPLSPNTTGWQYKSTRATINAIIDCPEAPVFLEDPAIMYSVTEVENEKPFTSEQMQKIYDLLIEAQTGDVLGATTVNVDALDYSNPNYDLMFGK